MTSQREILLKVAKKHGINIGQAEEIWNLIGNKIAEVIGDLDKKTNDLYDADKFHIIHIDNFGKFIPNKNKIRHANHCLKLKLKQNGSKHNTTDIEE
jgi:hypothetical protein